MRVGFVGLGKLGLPVATTMASLGVEVHGYDPYVTGHSGIEHEEGYAERIGAAGDNLIFGNLEDACRSEVVFVAVQTPHDALYEGVTRIPPTRRDFDYSYLERAARDIALVCTHRKLTPTVAVISTVLPGTMTRIVRPALGSLPLAYNPSFIAMGTVIEDWLAPEFVLLGGDDGKVRGVYEFCGVGPFYETTIPDAELIKVAYNTFIGLKLAFANTLMEVCHKTDCNVDEVTGALKRANRRLISGAYLDGGMGDGGGCHPRDNIALSWLARELDLSYDLFEAAMGQREGQAEWLVDLLCDYELDKGILGLAYKPQSHITTGSPAVLVANLLRQRGLTPYRHDPYVGMGQMPAHPLVWLVGCKHPEFPDYRFPEGSVVIDPWRYIPDQPGVEVVRLGA